MPKRKLWTERIFDSFPIGTVHNRGSFIVVRFVRFLCFSSIFWLTGFVAIVIDGMMSPSGMPLLPWFIQMMIFLSVIAFLVFVISGWISNKWDWFFNWSRQILKLSEPEFEKFHHRIERFTTSLFPCFAIALIGFICLAVIPQFDGFLAALMRPVISSYWWIFVSALTYLFLGTMLWMIIAMWIGIFLTFRQPLNLKLSRRTNRDFRPLAIWSLKSSLMYFMGATYILIFQYANPQYVVLSTIPLMVVDAFIILFGVIAFLLPFYNIHRALVKLKRRELEAIEEESNKLIGELTETLAHAYPAGNSKDNISLINSRLNILHIRERSVTEADEWPIDVTVLSLLAGIVLMPLLTKVIVDFFFLFFTA